MIQRAPTPISGLQPRSPAWWKVDLEGIYSLTSIVIRNYVDGIRYYHYNIQVSTDDITYTQVAEKTNDNVAVDDGDTYNISANARYIKVNMTYSSTLASVHITDFRVYGNNILTITGVTAGNKIYDGTTDAVLNTGSASLSGVSGTDAVDLISSGATGIFADKTIGTGKDGIYLRIYNIRSRCRKVYSGSTDSICRYYSQTTHYIRQFYCK